MMLSHTFLSSARIPLMIGLFVVGGIVAYFHFFNVSIVQIINHPELLSYYSDYTVGLAFAILCTFFIFIMPFKEKRVVLCGWLFKLAIIYLLSLYYETYYPILDSYGYFDMAAHRAFDGLALGTKNIGIMLSAFFSLTTISYRAGTVLFAFFGFLGQYLFWHSIAHYVKGRNRVFLYLILFTPSLLFWPSLIGKESLLLLCVGIYCIGLCHLLFEKKLLKPFVYISISFAGFYSFRFWLIALFAVALFFSLFIARSIHFKIIKMSGVFGLCAIGILLLFSYFNIMNITNLFVWLQSFAQGWASGGSAQIVHFDSISSLFVHYPWMMVTSLFRPLIFEGQTFFMFLAGLENTILFILFVVAIYLIIRNWKNRSALLVSLLIHVICFAIMYGLVSYQNLGTAVRFKVFILPFMITFIYFSISRYMSYKLPLS